MEINGRLIAAEIKEKIKKKLDTLSKHGVTPKIAIITLGPEDAWETYVNQKIKLADELGIKTLLINFSQSNYEKLFDILKKLDSDPKIHGIIIQRPIPQNLNRRKLIDAISPKKDIDGFRKDSVFEVPAWMAVKKIIDMTGGFENKEIVVFGKGETAGGPVINGLIKMGHKPMVVDSKSENPQNALETADIIISAVGKTIIDPKKIKEGALLVGIGISKSNGKLYGDYPEIESDLEGKDYTPTPGGVGPINLAYLFENLVKAAKISIDK